MDYDLLKGSLNPLNVIKWIKYKIRFAKEHPGYFYPSGLMIFSGAQGNGKTLSAVQYITKLSFEYPNAIICTNTQINTLNPKSKVIEYDGLDCLKNIENGELGVVYFIDEIHLEMNSLESKNIDIDIMTEISQQRKQRKHIVGTSQVFCRMAKPLREQAKDVIITKNYFGFLQWNKLVDAETAVEKDGKLVAEVKKRFIWFHTPELYGSYDTYAKMKRYRDEWQGKPRKEYVIVE